MRTDEFRIGAVNDEPLMLKISKVVNEAVDLNTFYFDHKLEIKPGQFVILWIPRVDEKPFSVSFLDKEQFGITVAKVGPFTEKLFNLKPGDRIGLRGPYGTSFNLEKEKRHIVIIGGGCGCAPVSFLAEDALRKDFNVTIIFGAKSKKFLMPTNRLKKLGAGVILTTDDGSEGLKGFTTQAFENYIKKEKVDKVFACGPEIMMKKIVEICQKKGIDGEVSLERYMKCGLGICGSCCVDSSGKRVCTDGPVFNIKEVSGFSEFGVYKRDASGKRVSL